MARFNVLGVDDQRERARPGEPCSMLRGIEGLVRRDIPNVLLSHNPDTFPRAAAMGIELSLAGHTHGGQIRFALGNRQWSPASLLAPFVAAMCRLPLASRRGLKTVGLRRALRRMRLPVCESRGWARSASPCAWESPGDEGPYAPGGG